jgi:tRNA dimethylallyltransferase
MSSSDALDGAELRIICGPTAAGKSAVALDFAARHGATIISADSRQVYRGFDIGTAKPSPAERARVPHRGIDVADPEERYSAARWADAAEGWIASARSDGGAPLIVGGTGLYLRALVTPLFAEPLLDPSRRTALSAELEPLSISALRAWCARVDPALATLGRSQLLRAIEIATLTGTRLSDLHRTAARAAVHAARYLVVDPGPSLAARIETRVDGMLAAGWASEVRALECSVSPAAPAWKASGYGWVREMAAGRVDEAMARERIVIETRQYAKRQRTWFRHQLPPERTTRVSPDDPQFTRIADEWWEGET